MMHEFDEYTINVVHSNDSWIVSQQYFSLKITNWKNRLDSDELKLFLLLVFV